MAYGDTRSQTYIQTHTPQTHRHARLTKTCRHKHRERETQTQTERERDMQTQTEAERNPDTHLALLVPKKHNTHHGVQRGH